MKFELKLDKEKKMLYGPFLIPNKLIPRRNSERGNFYIRFREEEIEKIAHKFNRDKNSNNINLMHTSQKVEAFVAENWIVGKNDRSKDLGFDLPEGSWFGGVKVTDNAFWESEVKLGNVKGFSVEILADMKLALQKIEEHMEKPNEQTLENQEVEENKETVETNLEETPVETIEENKPQMLTAEDVNKMIDQRFLSLMEEITSLKSLLETKKDETEDEVNRNNKLTQLETELAAVKEVLSSTPMVSKEETPKKKSEFDLQLERIVELSKTISR